MSNTLREALITKLCEKGLTAIADAVKSNSSNQLSLDEQQVLIQTTNQLKQELGYGEHGVDVGFAGKSPVAGAPGRLMEIEE